MNIAKSILLSLVLGAAAFGDRAALSAAPSTGSGPAPGEPPGRVKSSSKLEITGDLQTGTVTVSWVGRGVLKQGRELGGHFKAVGKSAGGSNVYVIDPTEDQALFRVEAASSPVFSVNIVGYVNLSLPPGLSLIANPLYYTNNALSFWLPQAPDGAQVFKYLAGGGFEVSTFDAAAGAWSNPDLQVPIGEGFYFHNPSSQAFGYTFFGEVHQGTLVNPLAAGISTKGSLVPQSGSINSLHGIPGQPGDEIRIYTPDGQNGGVYSSSVFDATANAWVPDLTLGVGQGFWIQKQNPQDWVRIFFAN